MGRAARGFGQGAHGAENEVIFAGGEIGGEVAVDGERKIARLLRFDDIANVGEGDDALQRMHAIGARATDLQSQIDLGRRVDAHAHRFADRDGGAGGKPLAILPSSASRLSASSDSARCHWKRASMRRLRRQ